MPAAAAASGACGRLDGLRARSVVWSILLLFKAELTLVVVRCVPLAKEVRRHVLDCLIPGRTLVGLAYLIGPVSARDINLITSFKCQLGNGIFELT